MTRTNRILGAILVILGALFLLKNLNIVNPLFDIFNFGNLISMFWPSLFLLLPGLLFHYGYAKGNKRSPGLLIPGGMLLVWGVTCQLSMIFNIWGATWPGFILGFAFGLYEFYLCTKIKGLLIPIGILGGLSAIFFATFSLNELIGYNTRKSITPIVLIIIGLIVIFGGRRKKEF